MRRARWAAAIVAVVAAVAAAIGGLRLMLGSSAQTVPAAQSAQSAQAAQPGQPTQSAQPAASASQTASHGQFENVPVFQPAGTPRQFALLFSDAETPSAADLELARSMSSDGAMVALVSLPRFYRLIAAASAKCVYAGGAVENFARYVQAEFKLPGYIEPILVGTGPEGGAFVQALLAQAPADNFTGALSLGFCPRLSLPMPMCSGNALKWKPAADGKSIRLQPPQSLPSPWIVLPSGTPQEAACAADARDFLLRAPKAAWQPPAAAPAPAGAGATTTTATGTPAALRSAFAWLAAQRAPLGMPPAALADLPVVEVPVAASAGTTPAGAANGRRFAILISGDGGWASIDKQLAAGLVREGVPVAGLDSLRYFWKARTPEGLAIDLDRMIRYYAARWKRSELLLIGYSQGADVLPFALNRLPANSRDSVRLLALLGPGLKASFEFHVSNWLGPSGDKPIAPEMSSMSAARTLCFYGSDERKNSLCPQLAAANATVVSFPGGHHLGGDYDALALRILAALPHE